jgi:hypothetical protein
MVENYGEQVNGSSNGRVDSLLAAVQDYIARDWPLVLCYPRSKRPIGDDWQHRATTHPSILDWLREHSDANLGVKLGPGPNLIDVECDSEEAERNLVELLGPELAGSVPQYRGARGLHRLFPWPPGFPDRASFRWHGVEFRVGGGGMGAQSILPPSVHPDGSIYTWVVPPNGQPLVPLPEAVVARVVAEMDRDDEGKGKGGQGGESPTLDEAGIFGPGERHPFLLSQAARLRAMGYAPAEIYAMLVALNEQRCRPRKSDEELRDIAEWFETKEDGAGGWGLNPPVFVRSNRGKAQSAGPRLPPPTDFPVEALPPVLAEFVAQVAAAQGCSSPFVALPAIIACFGCIGNTRCIRIKDTWTEPALGWGCVIGESGDGKSPAQRAALAPLHKVKARLACEYHKELEKYNWSREKYLKARAEKLKEAAEAARTGEDIKEPPAAPERPKDVRIIVSDITIEKLALVLADNGRGVFLERPELTAWINSFTRYAGKDAASSDLPHWLSIFDTDPILVDRKSGDCPSIHVPHAAVSIVGGMQPGIWRRVIGQSYYDSGLAARMLLAWPPAKKREWTDAVADGAHVAAYGQLLEDLLRISLNTDTDGPVPFAVKMTPEAYVAWKEFFNEWGERVDAATGNQRAMLSKLERYCARLALLHHVVGHVSKREDDCNPVEVDSVKAAAVLVKWFAAEAERVYFYLSRDEATVDRKALVDFVRRRGGQITPRNLHNSNHSRYPTTGDAEKALEALAVANLGRWSPSTGGRPGKVFCLAPEPPSEPDDEEDRGA